MTLLSSLATGHVISYRTAE